MGIIETGESWGLPARPGGGDEIRRVSVLNRRSGPPAPLRRIRQANPVGPRFQTGKADRQLLRAFDHNCRAQRNQRSHYALSKGGRTDCGVHGRDGGDKNSRTLNKSLVIPNCSTQLLIDPFIRMVKHHSVLALNIAMSMGELTVTSSIRTI